jgi:hypothetical protein
MALRSINCYLAWSAMNYLLYHTQYLQICQTTCFFVIIYLRPKISSDKIWKKTLYWPGPVNIKRLLHVFIFHIGPGISPRLPYQARQRSWRADMGRGLLPGTIWKISCHNLFITYFTLTFSKHWLLYCKKVFELTNCENKSLRELPLFNFQILICFESGFKNIPNNVDLYVQWR